MSDRDGGSLAAVSRGLPDQPRLLEQEKGAAAGKDDGPVD
jgi:hypothetical protein